MAKTKKSPKIIALALIMVLLLSPLAIAQGKDGDNGVSRGGDSSGGGSTDASSGAGSDAGSVSSSGGTPDQDMVSAAIEAGIISDGGFLSIDPDVTDPDAMTTTDWVFSGLSLLAGAFTFGAVPAIQLAVAGGVYAGGKMAGAKTAQERIGEQVLSTIADYAGVKSDPTATQTSVTVERDWVSVNINSGGGGANA